MSDTRAALIGAVGVLVGAIIAGWVAVDTVSEQGKTQLKILHASNAFSISSSMRPKAQDFSDASQALIRWNGSNDLNATSDASVGDYLGKTDRTIAAAYAISPYLDYSFSKYVSDYVGSVREVAGAVKSSNSPGEALNKRLNCQYGNLEVLIARRLFELDALSLPDLVDASKPGAAQKAKLQVCE